MKNPLLTSALERAYHNQMLANRFPVAFLALELDPREVDVNVHPTKLQIRFAREREVGRAVYTAVATVLGRSNLVPGLKPTISYLDYRDQDRSQGEGETGTLPLEVAEGQTPAALTKDNVVVPAVGKRNSSYSFSTMEPELGARKPNPTFPSWNPWDRSIKPILSPGVWPACSLSISMPPMNG